MILSIIAAIGINNELGYQNKLLWHISADMKWFRRMTSGHAVIMGRRTFESIGNTPLPKRTNIVISNSKRQLHPNIIMAGSIEEAINLVQYEDEVFVLGGANVYEQMLPLCNRMYLTHVKKSYKADAFFPQYKADQWEIIEQTDITDDEQAGVDYSFCIYKKRA